MRRPRRTTRRRRPRTSRAEPGLSVFEVVAILLAGVAAGTINTVVGSGTLITFPTLLAFGVPPVTANVSNTIGLVPGTVTGAWGYRRELSGQRSRVLRLGAASLVGGVVGAVLLLVLPAGAFEAIVPALILLGVLLVIAGPRLSKWVARRAEERGERRPPVRLVGVARRTRHRCVRRLLRCGPGGAVDGGPRHRRRRVAAAPQRGQERAGRRSSTASQAWCSSSSPRSTGWSCC